MKEEKEKASETANGTAAEALQTAAQVPPESSEVDQLKRDLAASAKEVEKFHDLYLRERAELENFKRRMQREKAEALKYENDRLMRELLPTVDNLARALQHAREKSEGDALYEGVQLVLKTMLDTLQGFGMSQIDSVGKPFDPEKHEAIGYVETDQSGPSVVLEEHQKGYFYKDRLLRPALVTVSKPQMAREDTGGAKENGSVEKPQADD